MSDAPRRKLIVTNHALDQFRARRRAQGEGDYRDGILRVEIRDMVTAALETPSMVLDHKPAGFILYRDKRGGRLAPGQIFVRPHDDYGFIVKQTDTENVIVTMISRVGVRR